jgi:exosortase
VLTVKRSASATIPEVQLPDATWAPARSALRLTVRDVSYLMLVGLSLVWCWQPLTTIVGRSLKSADYEHYSHIILLPFFGAYLVYLNRHAIFERVEYGLRLGLPLAAFGTVTAALAQTTLITGDHEHQLSLVMFGLVGLWMGGFALCYGARALGGAAFPFFLLLFMIPLPPALLTGIIVFLQKASAEGAAILFPLIGMPVLRDGVYFALPGINIEVARECSGIRSSIALLISGLVMAYLLLKSTWARTSLVLVIVPLAIAKNAVRIVGLSWLAVHVDPSFITGSAVHRNGGIPVFLTSLAVLGALTWLLRKCELRRST